MSIRKQKAMISALSLALSLMLLTGCGNPEQKPIPDGSGKKPVIAVSIIPEKTFAEAVCGDLAEVIALIPPGYSPENYEPRPEHIEKFQSCAIYFTLGVPAEDAAILPKIKGNSKIRIVRVQDEVAKAYPEREISPGERDPHIWLSPKRAKVMVKVIEREMSALDPKNREKYQENAERFTDELDKLEERLKTAFEALNNKKFIAFHPAFGYLADDYGMTMYALEEHGKEATPRHLQEMIDIAERENIRVVFCQSEIDSRQSVSFAEEIGGEVVRLDPLSPDYIENLEKMAESIAEAIR